MEDKFAKQLKQIVSDVVEEKLQPIREQIARIPDDMINVFNNGFEALVSRRLNEVEETDANHEKRIKKLEKNSFLPT